MQNNPFSVPVSALRDLDYCFYAMCWMKPPDQIRRTFHYFPNHINLTAISAYLNAERAPVEYISPFFPENRRQAFCSHKLMLGWPDERIALNFPLSTQGVDLAALRRSLSDIQSLRRTILAL
jgi:hypothetical protein